MKRRTLLRMGIGTIGFGLLGWQTRFFGQPASATVMSTNSAIENAYQWLLSQIDNEQIGGPITTDWAVQAFVAAHAVRDLPPPELNICDTTDCLDPNFPDYRLVKSCARTILTRLARGLPVNQALIDLLQTELQAELDPEHSRYPRVATKTFGVLALLALERDLGIMLPQLKADLLAVLAAFQNTDGGWPLAYDGSASSVSDITAEAVLCGLPGEAYLLNHQNPDGGMGYGGSLTLSTADSTAWMLLALPENDEARNFLLDCQDPPGYFKRSPTDDWPTQEAHWLTTAYAVLALSGVGYPVPQLDESSGVPESSARDFTLRCQPSPFRSATTISFDLPSFGSFQLGAYNVSGRQVWRTEGSGEGRQTVTWDGRDHTGARLSRGCYLIRLSTKAGLHGRKVLYLQ
ncbi:MAG: prenyltransferase/squalene oxidase repeat-containing protein [bacterium]|nr:prenyltransferase/squalene oxidase repeat-containing protein [bacterium]